MTTCEKCGRAHFEKDRKFGRCGENGPLIDRNRPICRMYLSRPMFPKARKDAGEKRGQRQVRMEDLP